jgi:hypothetical protein
MTACIGPKLALDFTDFEIGPYSIRRYIMSWSCWIIVNSLDTNFIRSAFDPVRQAVFAFQVQKICAIFG